MSMNEGWAEVTLAAGTGTANWKHPAQIQAGYAVAEQVELDDAPEFNSYYYKSVTNGGVISLAFTKSGVTATSTNVGDASVIRVYGKVRELPQNWEA